MIKFGIVTFLHILMSIGWSPVEADSDTMQINGIELSYLSAGQGVPVVLVHGHISDNRVWLPIMERMSVSYKLIAYTQKYYGTAPWPDNGEQFFRNTHVSDLIAFIEELDLGPVHVLTRSYGGYVAVHAMLQRPHLFRSSVHFEPAKGDSIQGLPGSRHAASELMDLMKPVIELVSKHGRVVQPFFSMKPLPAASCEKLSSLPIPTMVVLGDSTLVWFAMAAEQLAMCLPNSKVTIFKNANHDGISRYPRKFSELALDFLRANS